MNEDPDILSPPPRRCGTCACFKALTGERDEAEQYCKPEERSKLSQHGECLAPVPKCCPDPYKYGVRRNDEFEYDEPPWVSGMERSMTIIEKMRERYGKAAYDASLPTGADVVQVVGIGTVSMWSRLSGDEREQWRRIGDAAVEASHTHGAFDNFVEHGNASDGLWHEPKAGDA